MAEYIEREALLAHLDERRDYLFKENGDYDHYTSGFDEAVEKVENFPIAADVVERKRGEWDTTDSLLGWCCICSVCGSCSTMEYKYCPNCGADMRGEEAEDGKI